MLTVCLGDVLDEVDQRAGADYLSLPVLSLTKDRGLIPQTQRFKHRVATEDVSEYKVVRSGYLVYNPYVLWEGAIHTLRTGQGLVSPVYPVWKASGADPWYLDYLLRSPRLIAEYERIAAGTVKRRRAVSKDGFRGIRVPLPPIAEQRRIARTLSTIQRAKEATEKVIRYTAALRHSVVSILFEPMSSWLTCRLGDQITFQRGHDLPSRNRLAGNVPVVSSSGTTGFHSEARVDGPGVVIGRYGTLGLVHFIPGPYWPLNTALYVRDFHRNNPKFVKYFLETLSYEVHNDKTSVPGINRNDLHALPVSWPGRDDQTHIVEVLDSIDDKARAELATSSAISALFNSALGQLFGSNR